MANQNTPNPSVPSQVVQEVKFPRFVNNLGIIPTSYKDSMSYYECLAWLCKYLEETVIPTVNENGEAVEELQGLYVELNNYVSNYLDDYNFQEEVNQKMDELVETGELITLLHDFLPVTTPELFGAKGDGTTDDTSAINNAINSGAKLILFQPNTYLVSDRIVIEDINGLVIEGNGATIKADESTTMQSISPYDIFLVKGYNSSFITLNNLIVDCSKEFIVRTDDTTGTYAENTAKYLASRGKGYSGINFEKCNNIIIDNCYVKYAGQGIGFKNTKNSSIRNSRVDYTLTDAFPVWYGSQNILVENCYCYNNGDDAFPVFSLTTYWDYENTEISCDQCENITYLNCKSVNERARGLINQGGNNISFIGCKFENVDWCMRIGDTDPNRNIYDTGNTLIQDCYFNSEPQYGITSPLRMTFASNTTTGKILIDNCRFNSLTSTTNQQQIGIGNYCDLHIRNSKFNGFKFERLSGTHSYKNYIENSSFSSISYPNFDAINLIIHDSEFTNEGTGTQGIYFHACTNLEVKNLKFNTGKIISGSATNIIIDDINLLGDSTRQNATSINLTDINVTTSLKNGTYTENNIQVVNGIPYIYKSSAWKMPLFVQSSGTLTQSTTINDVDNLYTETGLKLNICTSGVAHLPSTAMYLIFTYTNLGANIYSQLAISLDNNSLLYTRTGTGSWVQH